MRGGQDDPVLDVVQDDDPDEDLTLGYAYMRALAQADDNGWWVDTGSGPGAVYYFPRPRAV
jgi:hypothetical protein